MKKGWEGGRRRGRGEGRNRMRRRRKARSAKRNEKRKEKKKKTERVAWPRAVGLMSLIMEKYIKRHPVYFLKAISHLEILPPFPPQQPQPFLPLFFVPFFFLLPTFIPHPHSAHHLSPPSHFLLRNQKFPF